MNDLILAASFRDPSGFVFLRDGVLYRQVNQRCAEDYDCLMQSGLYDKLVEKGLLVSHEEVDVEPASSEIAYKIIRPTRVSFISYPYEWCFSALKQAALATLKTHRESLAHGMVLKDASAYNIQFVNAKPVFIDTLSFTSYVEGEPWVAYQQFCQHFLAPLALMAYNDIRNRQWLRTSIDGIPLDLASKQLPGRTRLNLGLLMHIHCHAKSQSRHANDAEHVERKIPKADTKKKISKTAVLGIIDNLSATIRKLQWNPTGTEWGEYYDGTNYSDKAMQAKLGLVEEYIDAVEPETVWDLGANTGRFSRIASARGIPTVSFDIDPVAVEKNFLDCTKNKESNLLPLVQDLTNPSPSLGWQNTERDSMLQRGPADTVLALALIHHLALSNNVPLPMLARFFAKTTKRFLIIEFVPKGDSQVRRLLATREDIFPDYNYVGFEAAFSEEFSIEKKCAVEGSERSLYLMKKREHK